MTQNKPYFWEANQGARAGAQRSRPGAPDGGGGVVAGLALLGCTAAAGGAALLWAMGDAQRTLLRILLWDLNQVPTLTSVAVGVLFFLPAPFVAARTRRVRWLTPEHRQVLEDRRTEEAGRPLREQLVRNGPGLVALGLALGGWGFVWWTQLPVYVFPDVAEYDLVGWVRPLVDGLTLWGNRFNSWGMALVLLVDVTVVWMALARFWVLLVDRVGPVGGFGRLPDPGDYQKKKGSLGRPATWRPWPTMLLGAREYPESRIFEPDAAVPSWVEYGGKPIFGGLLIFGQKGSGKTSLIKRMLEDLIRFRADEDAHKPAVVAIDPKGDLSAFIEEVAAKHGRSGDVVRLGVRTKARWNPFAQLGPRTTAQEAKQAGFFLRCAMSTGSSENAYWDDNADNLLTYSIHLLALSGELVGFSRLASWVTTLKEGEDEEKRHAQYEVAEGMLMQRFRGEVLADRLRELEATRDYFEEEFCRLDAKPRGIVVNVCTNFLRKFEASEYQRAFCGPATEPGHFEGFPELIRRGGIFVLDIRATEDGAIAGAMCMLAKLFYQAAVKQRDRYEEDWSTRRVKRITATVWDEYQSYVTTSGGGKQGDAEYLETSRSFFAVDIAATQQLSSIQAAVGGQEAAAQRVAGSFNNLVTFLHNDPVLVRYLQQLVGKREREQLRLSVSEGVQGAERDAIGTLREASHSVNQQVQVARQLEERLPPELFAQLQAFEAIGIFTDPKGRKVVRFCAKPYFANARQRHAAVVDLAMQEGSG